MIIIGIIISLSYVFLIGSFIYGFGKVPAFYLEKLPPKTYFSVIIPFRNEAENLPYLLVSIRTLNYPTEKFEIIFVNDDSEDASAEIITRDLQKSEINFSVINNQRFSNSPKKDAISTAIKKAKNEWIITTDADCILPEFWLDSFDEFIQKNDTVCIAGPVAYTEKHSFLNQFQILDLHSLQGGTMGGFGIKQPFLCNGANFAYKNSLFKSLNGFDGNTNIASGDDIFMLEKVAKTHPKKLYYLKCQHAIVKTNAQPSWKSLIEQRVRWAAKTSSYNSCFGKFTGFLVFFMNALIVVGLALSLLDLFSIKTWFYLFLTKFVVDFYLINKSASFFNQQKALKGFIYAAMVYPFFSVYVAVVSVFSSYHWKGRTFKK